MPDVWAAVIALAVASVTGGVVTSLVVRSAELGLARRAGPSTYWIVDVSGRFVGALVGACLAVAVVDSVAYVAVVTPVVLAALVTAVETVVVAARPALRG